MIIGIIFTSVGAFILALTLGLNLLLHEGALFMILPTSFCQGSSQYPLGMIIDIWNIRENMNMIQARYVMKFSWANRN